MSTNVVVSDCRSGSYRTEARLSPFAYEAIPPARFELTTFGLGIRRSIQLSYEGMRRTIAVLPPREGILAICTSGGYRKRRVRQLGFEHYES
jgi:hypothetical protein